MTAYEFPDLSTVATADEARGVVIAWQHAFADRVMSWGEVAEETSQLGALAERFDLVDEFRENGVI